MANKPHLTTDLQQQAIQLARESIQYGFTHNKPLEIDVKQFPPDLQQTLSCFVTLNRHHQLRGCIGHLSASQALVLDIVENAFSAAFKDPRFLPLKPKEWPDTTIEISVLGEAYEVAIASESDLINKLRPNIDGLILKSGYQQATFLPSVWETLPNPKDFVHHLKQKAGISSHHWPNNMQCYFYQTQSFS